MTAMPHRLDTGAEQRRNGLDRRQLLKAGAWAAPAIVLAAAVPAASASTNANALTVPATLSPTVNGVNVNFQFNIPITQAVTDSSAVIQIVRTDGTGGEWDDDTRGIGSRSAAGIPVGQGTLRFEFPRFKKGHPNNSSYSFTVTFTWTLGGQTHTASATGSF